ncbi:MAG: cation:proton antiporter [Candidatus Bathyarchaeia archaeon]|jgi:Kef-type K+ transport system membrane component KefB
MVSTVVVLAVVLATAFLFNELFKKLKLPPVVGQILGGLILGLPLLRTLIFQDSASTEIVDLLAVLGILFLLLLVGLEIDIEKIRQSSKDAILISFCAAIVPLVLGFGVLQLLGYSVIASLVFGGALSVTAEGTTVKVLMDANALNTRIGAITVSAGAVDDIFEVLFLSLVTVVGFGGSVFQLVYLPVEFLVFAAITFALFWVISKALQRIERKETDVELFSLVIIFVLLVASLSETLEMGYLIGALVAGFLLQISMKRLQKKDSDEIINTTKLITLAFVVPFFFVNIGLNFNYDYLLGNLPLVLVTIIIAFAGKIVGTLIVKPFTKLSLRQLYLIGWGMNSRGAVELVIALLALNHGLITQEIFSALVAMAIVTTLVFPFVLQREIKNNPESLQ